jgi:outer membrane lipoprotein carrier protein
MAATQNQTDKNNRKQRRKNRRSHFVQTSRRWIQSFSSDLPGIWSFKKIILILISALSFHGVSAQTIDFQSLKSNLNRISALSGQFSQENVDLLQDRKSKAQGRFYFMRPGLMRWIYEQPDPYSIIVGKERIWLFDPILENVTIYNVQNVSGIKIISLLLEPENLHQHFKTVQPSKMLLDVEPDDKLLFLTQKEKSQDIAELQLAFTGNYQIKQFVIVDMNQNYRKITLSQLNIRPQISKADFEFNLPDGIEIIDKTGDKH